MLSAVVLAAGASSRMGRHKLLLPLGGEPIVRRTVREVGAAGFDDVLVVLGREADELRAAVADLPCRTVLNPDYTKGLGTSFRAAVAALGACEGALFTLADQPFVSAADYARVRQVFEAERPPIVCARFGDVTAPPHLFARAIFPELAELTDGARPVLARHAAELRVVQLPADHLVDIDTPDDYARACRRLDGAT